MIRSDECLADVIALRTVSKSFVAPAVMQNCLKLSGSYTWIPLFTTISLYILFFTIVSSCFMSHPTWKKNFILGNKTKKCYLKEMIKMGMKPKTLLYHKAFFKTLLLFKLRLGILPRVHLTAKLSLVCYTDFLFFLRPLSKQVKIQLQGINWALAQALVVVFMHS